MSYTALYRTWRPQTFADITGQKHVTQTIQNALLQEKFSHAYLFSGPRGIGKTSIAKIFAKAINCKVGSRDEPCNACDACLAITNGELMDVIEIDAASNRGVDEIRDLREQVKYAPTNVDYKVFIIDEAHMLTNEAFNALLKTLEEPPPHVIFILATTEPYKLPLTIISRCQRFDFKRISTQDIAERLTYICQEIDHEFDPEAISMIAYAAEGGLRDALSILDQSLALADGKLEVGHVESILGSVNKELLLKLFEQILAQDIKESLLTLDQAIADGKDVKQLVKDMVAFCRDMLLLKVAPSMIDISHWPVAEDRITSLGDLASQEEWIGFLDKIADSDSRIRHLNQPLVLVELLLVQLCQRDVLLASPGSQSSGATSPGGPSNQAPAGGGSSTGQISAKELANLQAEINRLTLRVQELEKAGPSDSRMTARKKPALREKSQEEIYKELVEIYDHNNKGVYAKIAENWSSILDNMKARQKATYAWFSDSEIVAVYQEYIVAAFNGAIHKETIDKAENLQLVEETFLRTTGKPFKLKTVMLADWKKANKLETAEDDGASQVLDKAVELFGADFVEVIEDPKS